ncbi:TonB-dependent receptor [Christiangramia sabulilitoris]|uniref:TonB-dependent receptor n=1 Tax=Christiangramia sabulilitoris TaxID=2583991 RepID=A0A550I6Q2_9FLAO|nr:TonB-dependent receptor [Christiangramia sabulilitoris]TRO66654.1 TonB-dependent receptor [Christiangramia sabulilitoris]
MKKLLNLLFTISICCCTSASAQIDSINWLDEVVLSDAKLINNSKAQLVRKLEDSVIQQSEPLLTSLLKFNSPFFFRENGYGMVASASVRGTGAAQTAVVWNGININSQFTGQTDFNTINTRVYDNVSVKPGGGSVVYGSGAIGGTIHLNDDFQFNGSVNNRISTGVGSFETIQANYKGDFSSEKTSLSIGISGISSVNDYKYTGTELINENGDFYNASVNASIAHWLDSRHLLKFYSNYYQGERGFSGTINLNSNSKYVDENSRNLLEWKYFSGNLNSNLKFAWIKEKFEYYENRESSEFNFGEAETAIIKYDLGYRITDNTKLNVIADYTDVNGEGTGIFHAKRKIGGISFLWDHNIEKFNYQLSFRQEITDSYKSPLLFSAGLSFQLSENYLLRFNSSRNFRMPTINDLFWQNGGNPDLDPETSLQAEIGSGIVFENFKIDLSAYVIDIENLIRWTPDATGLWRPVNTKEVYNYGIEAFAEWKTSFYGNDLNLTGTYAFTRSIDKETDNQLIYVPGNKATISAGYSIKRFSLNLQSLYNGSIYTSSDNEYQLDGYTLANLGVSYTLNTKPEINLSATIDNAFNKKYESLPSRIMPGRSYRTTLTLKF